MNQDEQRVAIAKACGYRDFEVFKNLGSIWAISPSEEAREIPQYLNDLNACAEMEKTISSDGAEWNLYRMNLMRLCSKAKEITDDISAPASLRCKAFLLTKGEWKP